MPMNIYLTPDLQLAMFGDIRRISKADGDSKLETSLPAPYGCQGQIHITRLDKADSYRDLF